LIYNPGYLYLILLAVLSIIGFYLIRKKELFQTLLVWFIVPFVIFEFVIQNPGTHTHNYLIPLFIASGIAFQRFGWFLRSTLIGVLGVVLLIQFYVFLPRFNDGYPFQNGNLAGFEMKTIDTRYHVPIYGFVYERGWKEIAEIMKQEKRVPNFSTNDNKVVSEFYLHGYFYQEFYKDKLPFYYVYIKNPQTQKFLNETFDTADKLAEQGEKMLRENYFHNTAAKERRRSVLSLVGYLRETRNSVANLLRLRYLIG
jgi:hypothetical protein